MNTGPLIAFEGTDGCGKSTQLDRLTSSLETAGIAHVSTREPTAGEWGQRIRTMARSGERVAPEEELAWFMADRTEHVRDVIEPARARGEWVLTDRYYLSTVAYQGARGLDAAAILAESEARFPTPSLTLLFVLSADASIERVHARGGVAEPAFEELGFQKRVAEVFATLDLPHLVRIDAARDVDSIHRDVVRIVGERFGVELPA